MPDRTNWHDSVVRHPQAQALYLAAWRLEQVHILLLSSYFELIEVAVPRSEESRSRLHIVRSSVSHRRELCRT